MSVLGKECKSTAALLDACRVADSHVQSWMEHTRTRILTPQSELVDIPARLLEKRLNFEYVGDDSNRLFKGLERLLFHDCPDDTSEQEKKKQKV